MWDVLEVLGRLQKHLESSVWFDESNIQWLNCAYFNLERFDNAKN